MRLLGIWTGTRLPKWYGTASRWHPNEDDLHRVVMPRVLCPASACGAVGRLRGLVAAARIAGRPDGADWHELAAFWLALTRATGPARL